MIGKGSSIGHSSNAIGYAKEKQEAKEINRHMVSGETKEEILKEFKTFQDLNTRCEKNTFAFVVSPDPRDKLTDAGFRQVANNFLKEMKLDDRQHVAYLHVDNGKPHIHLYVNRIGMDGKAASDQYISNKASRAADKVAQQMKLIQAKEVMKEKQLQQQNTHKHVFEAHRDVLSKKPKNLTQYTELMSKKGFKPEFKYSNAGKAVGVKFDIGGTLLKGSAINPAMAAGKIVKSLVDLSIKQQLSFNQAPKRSRGNSNQLTP